MKRTVRITESDITRLVKKIVNEQSTNSKVVDDWTKFPCVAKLRDAVSPKGEKSKRGEDVFKDLLFYSNGRCMDITNKSKSFYKCHPSGAIVVSDDPNIDMDTIDVNTEKPMYEQSSKDISCLLNSGYKKDTIGGPMTRREVYSTKKNGMTYQISINGGVRVFDNKTHKEGKWSCENGKVKISGLKDTKMMPM